MKYIELTVHTTTEASELVSDAAWEFTALGVTVCDYNDVLALQKDRSVFWDYMDDEVASPRGDVLVKCFFEPASADAKISALVRELEERRELARGEIDFGTLETGRREIEGDDWIDVWKKHFRPVRLGKAVVVPAWLEYRKAADEAVVLLDSNMAFGTGEHETTALCAELMQDRLKAGDSVLDVGCGSGILGIAAAKLGAARCDLTDIDPVAVASAEHNVRLNGVADRVFVQKSDLLDGVERKADLIVANVTAEILVVLAPAVPAHLNEGGSVVLSGILADRIEKVEAAYEKEGLVRKKEARRGEWCALVYSK